MTSSWTISLVEKKLDMFGVWDNIILGKDAGHSYLLVRDDEGNPRYALEGNAYTPKDGSLAKGDQTTAGYLSAAARELGLGTIFNKAARLVGYDLNIPRLRVTVEDGNAYSQPGDQLIEHTVMTGPEDEIRRALVTATQAGAAINRADLMYQGIGLNDYGVNCHSVMRAMMDVMGIAREDQPRFMFASPGNTNNLFETVPGLTAYHPDRLAGLGVEDLKSAYNEAHYALADSLVSPELSERIAMAADNRETRGRTRWQFGYGVLAQG